MLEVLRRRWATVGATFVAFIALAALLTPMMTRIYRARATMLVELSPMRATTPRTKDR